MQLSAVEARVVAALVEKDRTTPDSYPLTTNSLIAACNQKTSRNPVMALTVAEVDAALLELRQRGMVRTVRGTGERTFKHRHILDEALDLDERELSGLAILMLRGPQTPGELRTRADRYVSFADFDAVEVTLRRLMEREEPLVRNTGRRPGQSQDRWIELVSEGSEPAASHDPVAPTMSAPGPSGPVFSPDVVVEPGPVLSPDVVFEAVGDRTDEIDALRADVEELRRLVDEIRTELGMTSDRHAGEQI